MAARTGPTGAIIDTDGRVMVEKWVKLTVVWDHKRSFSCKKQPLRMAILIQKPSIRGLTDSPTLGRGSGPLSDTGFAAVELRMLPGGIPRLALNSHQDWSVFFGTVRPRVESRADQLGFSYR